MHFYLVWCTEAYYVSLGTFTWGKLFWKKQGITSLKCDLGGFMALVGLSVSLIHAPLTVSIFAHLHSTWP